MHFDAPIAQTYGVDDAAMAAYHSRVMREMCFTMGCCGALCVGGVAAVIVLFAATGMI